MEAHRFRPIVEAQFDGALTLATCTCGWRAEWQKFTKAAARKDFQEHVEDVRDTEIQLEADYIKSDG